MPNRELLLYAVQGLYWTSFGMAGLFLKEPASGDATSRPPAPVTAATETVAPFSRSLLLIHALAFALMYFGLGNSLIPQRVTEWLPGQRLIGTAVIAVGAALMSWARVSFHSWRIRAKLDAGHQLATGGPFRYLRNPMYMGLNLLALGSALWAPNIFTWMGVLLMIIGSDLRARAEARILTVAFGPAYTSYASRTARFVPGVY